MGDISIKSLSGNAMLPHIGDLARLRIGVFREFPYLYEGSLDYEERYLRRYLENPQSVFVIAFEGKNVVGVSTGCPLECEPEETQAVFSKHGYAVRDVFYFGESVLLKEYRGQGIGNAFFDERERHALGLGSFRWTSFCAVERATGDKRRPKDFRPLDDFWKKRGYKKCPELQTTFEWCEVGATKETPHPMVFWMRKLPAKK